MGNSSSSANPPRQTPGQRASDQSPSADKIDPSLRQKKKSLELPDLTSLTSLTPAGRPKQPIQKTPAIAIPISPINNTVTPGEAGRIRAPITLPSTADVLTAAAAAAEPSTHRPFPPTQRAHQAHATLELRQAAEQRRLQELYNHYQNPSPPPQLPPAFVPEVVHSSIPIGLNKTDESPVMDPIEPTPDLVNVKITWRGPGKVVQLARAGDDDWKGRVTMERESPDSAAHHATVALPPGTHHIRFLIDDQWQVADDYPTAVDDQGSLANYVSVPISYSPPTATNIHTSVSQRLRVGQSFWSAASSADDDGSQDTDTPPGSVKESHIPHHHQHSQSQNMWTSRIPSELIEAAAEEERYVEASTGQLDASQHTVINGFIPAPNIPPAPSLPRHLDKLILNSRIVLGGAAPASSTSTLVGAGASSSSRSRGGGGREGRGATGSGRTKTTRGDQPRERRDRDRDGRGRERRSGSDTQQPPPPPPPSEVDLDVTNGGGSSIPGTPVPQSYEASSTPTPTSFVEPSTPTPTSVLASHQGGASGGVSPSPSVPPTPTIPASSTSRPLTLGLDSAPSEGQALTDDGSVLPVPSHVVLHHLCTSAIRNGVLAVADSTRYRKKYLTTIYYKPTSL